MTIREADLSDVASLTALYVAYRIFYGELPAWDAAQDFIHHRVEQQAARYFLARDSGRASAAPVAFMHLMPSTNTLAMRPIWLLEDLYVVPAARNRGVATALLRYAEAFARSSGAERITLSTAHDNLAAQSIYRRLGYVREEHFAYFHRLLS